MKGSLKYLASILWHLNMACLKPVIRSYVTALMEKLGQVYDIDLIMVKQSIGS